MPHKQALRLAPRTRTCDHLDEHSRASPGAEIRVRIGIHEGTVTQRDGTLYGQAVHAAARIMAEAAGGQILASTAVRDQADTASSLHRGGFWLEGFPRRWRLHEVP